MSKTAEASVSFVFFNARASSSSRLRFALRSARTSLADFRSDVASWSAPRAARDEQQGSHADLPLRSCAGENEVRGRVCVVIAGRGW